MISNIYIWDLVKYKDSTSNHLKENEYPINNIGTTQWGHGKQKTWVTHFT